MHESWHARSAAERLLSLRLLGPLILALTLWPLPLAAQLTGIVTGTVTTADSVPLSAARVSVIGTTIVATTHQDGGFRMTGVPVGNQTIQVNMLGYKPALLSLQMGTAETLKVQVTLTSEPVEIAAVEVRPDFYVPPEIRGFQERRARGSGTYFTHDDIARMQPRLLTDVLRRVAGVQIAPVNGEYGTSYTVQTGRNAGGLAARTCPVLFYVNGAPFPLSSDVPINHFIAPEDVVALEVYTGVAQIPAQFNSGMYSARCGVVVIWTRSGPEPTRSR